jgi:hypothetical protein
MLLKLHVCVLHVLVHAVCRWFNSSVRGVAPQLQQRTQQGWKACYIG